MTDPRSFEQMSHRKIGTLLMEDAELLEVLKGYHVVRLEDSGDDFNDKLKWCLEHCQNKFRDIRESKTTAWYFKSEHDATIFAMRWSS